MVIKMGHWVFEIDNASGDEEEVVFEVKVNYIPGMMSEKWEIKSMSKPLSEKFKSELWENLSVDIDNTDHIKTPKNMIPRNFEMKGCIKTWEEEG